MNPFTNPIKFKKANHFHVIKENNQCLKVEPEQGQEVYEVPHISGGKSKPLVLEIPIPLCEKHFASHDGKRFGVNMCNGWYYIAMPTKLGSTQCRECKNELFSPMPNLRSADLSYANLRYADLRYGNLISADLSYANLSYANLISADLISANLRYANLSYANLISADLSFADLRHAKNIDEVINLDKAYWNKFTQMDNKYKKLLSKDKFLKEKNK